jgi:hypothetical protein
MRARPKVEWSQTTSWSPGEGTTVMIDWCTKRGAAVLSEDGLEVATCTSVKVLASWSFDRGAQAVRFTAAAAGVL